MPDWRALITARLEAEALDPDVIDEIAEHAEELYRASLASGRTAGESLADVHAELADLPAVIRAARAARRRRPGPAPEPASPGRMRLAAAFARDLAYGVRTLAARPGTTLVAVVTLALGIGASTAIFSVVHSVLLAPLPFPEPDRLVMLWEADADDPEDFSIVSEPNYTDWSRLATSFESTAIWEYQSFNLAGGDDPEQVLGLRVSSSLFTVLRVAPQIGRTFSPAEDAPGHDVVVISDALWRRRFDADPSVAGRNIRLNGRPFEVIGVMPESFRFVRQRDAVWVPIQFTPQDRGRGSHSFQAAARLKDGVEFDAAKAEMMAIGRQLAAAHEENFGEIATISRMHEFGVAPLRETLLMLLGAVGLILLIACANVANLLLAQAAARQREFAIRTALGAAPARIGLQLFAEGLLLALAGGAAGILLAWLGTAALADSLPRAVSLAPFRDPAAVPLNATVLAFTFGLATLTGILFTMAPIAGSWRTSADAALRTGDRAGAPRLTWLRHTLVAAEVALAVIVLAATGLVIKSMMRLIEVDPGLVTANVLTMNMALPQADFYGAPERKSFCADVIREAGSLPGVQSVGAISHLPLSGANAGRGFAIEGRPEPPPGDGASAFYRVTCPGYFRTLGIPVIAGRDFSIDDRLGSPMVVILNELTAREYWPDESPLGRRIKFGDLSSDSPWLTIVGVVKNVRHFGLDVDEYPEIYRPYSQVAWPVMTVTVKTATEPMALASAARAALRRIDPDQPVSNIRSMDDVLNQSLGFRRFPMLLLGLFSGIALALAAIGVYGVVGYLASQRTREIGIRMALGARRGAVERLIVARSLAPIAIGVAGGIGGALAASRLLEAFLYQVRPSDPMVLTTIGGALASVAVLASWIPAHRAAGIDPVRVLRQD